MARQQSTRNQILTGIEPKRQTQHHPARHTSHAHHQIGIPKLSRRPPIFTKGPVNTRAVSPSPDTPPAGWQGTDIEWMVYQSLIRQGLAPNADFYYQSPMLGGSAQLGGLVADFVVIAYSVAIDVQGDYWHYDMGVSRQLTDRSQAAEMAALGYTPVFIDAEDVLADVDYYVREALAGHDHSRVTQGF